MAHSGISGTNEISRRSGAVRVRRHSTMRGERTQPGAVELSVILLIFALLTGANGFHILFNSAIPCGLLALCLLAWRTLSANELPKLRAYTWMVSLTLILWCVGAAVSAFLHISNETLLNLYAGYLAPLIIYGALVNKPVDDNDKQLMVVAAALGSCIPCTWAIVAYLNSFGLPAPLDLLWNRYDIPRMAAYQKIAFGNTSHMALYVAMLLPPFLVMAASRNIKPSHRIVFTLAALLSAINLLLIFSRAAMVTVLVLIAFWAIAFRSIRLIAVVSAIVLALPLLAGFEDISQVLLERTVGIVTDEDVVDPSVEGRLGSIAVGWRLFMEHPFFGVGPGLTYKLNDWSIAHQLNIEEGASIGFIGLIATVFLALLILVRSASIAIQRSAMSKVDAALWSGVLGWTVYTLLAGGLLNLGLLIPWAGILYGFLALSVPRTKHITG
jgi:O-antigen ligase